MREVTLYQATATTVMAGDRVEIYEQVIPYIHHTGVSVTGVNQSPEALITENRIELPVIHMRNDDGERVSDEFIAVDPTIRRLIQCYKNNQDAAESRAETARRDAHYANLELERIRNSSFWQRLKWAFAALGNKDVF